MASQGRRLTPAGLVYVKYTQLFRSNADVVRMWAAISEWLGDIVSPERCAACDEHVLPRRIFCPPCAMTLEPRTKDAAIAPYRYGGALARAIVRFKYEGRSDLARPLGSLLLRASPMFAPLGIDVVVPVPLHPARLADRGFNQAALLAAPLARALGAVHAPRALARTRNTSRQADLDRESRMTNVSFAFAARQPDVVEGKRILIVDDVRTTGSTLRACAAALTSARAGFVHAIALAFAEDF